MVGPLDLRHSSHSRFPRLINLSVFKVGFVSSFFSPRFNWNLHPRRNLTDPKILEFAVLSVSSFSFSPLPLVLTLEFGPSSHPVPFLFPLSSMPSHLALSHLLSLVRLYGSPFLLPKFKVFGN